MEKKLKTIKTQTIVYAMENPSDPENTQWYEKETYLSSEKDYDENGNLIKTITYNKYGSINEMLEYRYDEKNNCIEEICYLDEDSIAEHHFYGYDENNKKTQEKIIFNESGESLVYFTYDETGNLSERKVTDEFGNMEELELFQYASGKITSEQLFDDGNELVYEKKYTYDQNGNLAVFEYISPDDYENFRKEYFYNSNGLREKTLEYDASGRLKEKVLYTYDNEGRILSMIEENINGTRKTCYHYDEHGNQVKHEEFVNDDILVLSIERMYDSDGNLTESTVFSYEPGEEIYQMSATRFEYSYY